MISRVVNIFHLIITFPFIFYKLILNINILIIIGSYKLNMNMLLFLYFNTPPKIYNRFEIYFNF